MFISKAMAAFVTVAQERSLKKTAEKLCLTVPPVSRMLRNTEDWFGEKLIVVERNNVTLTPAGVNIYQQILPHYLSLLNISKRKPKSQLTISSPVVHSSFFDLFINILIPNITTCPIIKYAEYIREDDDIFVHFSHITPPVCFDETTLRVELHLSCHESVSSLWHSLNLLVGSELLYSEAFLDALSDLRECGFTGEVKQLDNSNIRTVLYQTGLGLTFSSKTGKTEVGKAILPFSYEQPFYIYQNKYLQRSELGPLTNEHTCIST
ncbi:helix-turn-helix domain-containing protein [Serratia plymuthica]|uniref:helix-turn-helix domain-containing protein n=1 Tax=Serratia plymuthica TaxID=82996 RepID=UPI003DA334A5